MIINPYKFNRETSTSINEIYNKEYKEESKDFLADKNKEEQLKEDILDVGFVDKIKEHLTTNHLKLLQQENKEIVKEKIQEFVMSLYPSITENDVSKLQDLVISKIFGYDILQKYIVDKDTTDIRVVGYDEIYIKQRGKWQKVKDKFNDKKAFEDYVRYCVLKNGSVINYETPMVILSDKKYRLRIEAGMPPVNVASPSLVIRIHKEDGEKNLETLFVKYNMIDNKIYSFLLKAVQEQKSIVLCGKGGSGKTTLLRAVLEKVPHETSITTNEETAELYLRGRNIIQRETIMNRNDDKNINLNKLAKHSLVMSSDYIILRRN